MRSHPVVRAVMNGLETLGKRFRPERHLILSSPELLVLAGRGRAGGGLSGMTLVSEHRFVIRTGELRELLENSLGDVFAIERELGGGGMSRVFLARERALDRQVVVKVLHPELAGI